MEASPNRRIFSEAKALQIRHQKLKKSEVNEEVEQFDKLMSTGKISAAIGCLSDKRTKEVLPLNEVIVDRGDSPIHCFTSQCLLMTRLDGTVVHHGHYPPQETSGIFSTR